MFGSKSYLTFNTFPNYLSTRLHIHQYMGPHTLPHTLLFPWLPPLLILPKCPSAHDPYCPFLPVAHGTPGARARRSRRSSRLLALQSAGLMTTQARARVGSMAASLPTSCSTPSCAGSATFLRLAHDTTSSRCLPPQSLAAEPTVHHEWKVAPPYS
jgi:hypothetical protein